ncbi:hypothetical protein CGCF413_v003807 [Colletotrichum fructicola]|nr:hypothetical protein CGCF413_v003807 [Colletotrichum fructicola]
MERMHTINAERSSPSLAASRDGVIAIIQTPSATHDNTFLPNPPSDDDIGLLRRADLACYFQLVHPNWSFLDENVLVEWFQACVEQKVPSNNYQSYFVQMLVEQFTVGIILISCFWGTPYIYRSTAFQAPDTLQALEDCGSTLSRFANRWKDAEVYYETYTLLTSQTPISFPDNSDFEFPDQLKPQISGLTQTLEERGVSMAVLAMIGRIISSPASTREYPSLQRQSQVISSECVLGLSSCSSQLPLQQSTAPASRPASRYLLS